MAPPKQSLENGPSKLSLALGIGQAGLSGFGTYNELKAPKAYVPRNVV